MASLINKIRYLGVCSIDVLPTFHLYVSSALSLYPSTPPPASGKRPPLVGAPLWAQSSLSADAEYRRARYISSVCAYISILFLINIIQDNPSLTCDYTDEYGRGKKNNTSLSMQIKEIVSSQKKNELRQQANRCKTQYYFDWRSGHRRDAGIGPGREARWITSEASF